MNAPRYGTANTEYIKTWFGLENDGPMWALNLMSYREFADYQDGRESNISGADADVQYTPIQSLTEVGARILFVADVAHQLTGDDIAWDRVAIAQYPRRMAIIEMQNLESFKEAHHHKEAGMKFTIVMATFPNPSSITAAQKDPSDLVLLQVSNSTSTPKISDRVDAQPIGTFDVEGVIMGDHRTFAVAHWHTISTADADQLVASKGSLNEYPESYSFILRPMINMIPQSIEEHFA